tara:strand:+ start:13560 stop:13772 length:213 start_codon:yes stop_codon:yes gene_type:complete
MFDESRIKLGTSIDSSFLTASILSWFLAAIAHLSLPEYLSLRYSTTSFPVKLVAPKTIRSYSLALISTLL